MARLARLALATQLHYVLQRGHNGGAIVSDDEDRRVFLDVLRDAARSYQCLLHAYALGETEVHLLTSPATGEALSRMMQALGRRYTAIFNRRHGRSGGLWDGRFRAAVVEPGAPELTALRLIDSAAALPDATAFSGVLRTSAEHRLGSKRDPALTDPQAYWQLGNTPFEREARYRELLAEPIAPTQRTQLQQATLRGWAFGSAAFLHALARQTSRPLRPRPRGRPARVTP